MKYWYTYAQAYRTRPPHRFTFQTEHTLKHPGRMRCQPPELL